MTWTVEPLDSTVESELEALPKDMRARLVWISQLIKSCGLENVREPYVKPVRGKIWEIRLTGKAGIARALYVTASGRRIVIVRVFVKKTRTTPKGEIEIAIERAKGVK